MGIKLEILKSLPSDLSPVGVPELFKKIKARNIEKLIGALEELNRADVISKTDDYKVRLTGCSSIQRYKKLRLKTIAEWSISITTLIFAILSVVLPLVLPSFHK